MTFEHWVSLIAVLTGPVGIVLGWFLAGRRESVATRTAARAAVVDRCVDLVRSARLVEAEARSLGHALYLHVTKQRPFGEADADRLNEAWKAFEDFQVVVAVVGPDWLATAALDFEAPMREYFNIAMDLQASSSAGGISRIQELIRTLEDALTRMRNEVRKNLGGDDPQRAHQQGGPLWPRTARQRRPQAHAPAEPAP